MIEDAFSRMFTLLQVRGCIYFSRVCTHIGRTHGSSFYFHYSAAIHITPAGKPSPMREDADFSLHPRPPSPPATYIFLSAHSFHRSPHIITGAHIYRGSERGSPSIQPSIHRAHSTSFYSFIQSNTWASPSRSSSSSCMHLYESTSYSYIRVILKTGVSAAPLSSLSVYAAAAATKKMGKISSPCAARRENPLGLFIFEGNSRCSWMGEKSPFLVIYLFTFLAARPLFSSLTATGNRWCTRRYWSPPRPLIDCFW